MSRRLGGFWVAFLALLIIVALAHPPTGLATSGPVFWSTDTLATDPQGPGPTDGPPLQALPPTPPIQVPADPPVEPVWVDTATGGGYLATGSSAPEPLIAGEGCVASAPQGGSCVVPPGTWQTKAPLPMALFGSAVASDGVYVYSTGGTTGAVAVPNMFRYNPLTDSWTSLAPLPVAVHEALAIYGEGRIYVIGGQDPTGLVVPHTQVYDIASNSWALGVPLPLPLHQAAGGFHHGELYVVGGYVTSDPASAQSLAWRFTIGSIAWVALPPMPAALGGAASGIVDGRLYVIGGRTSITAALRSVHEFDIATNSWRSMADMPTATNGPGSAVYGKQIWVMGGGNPVSAWSSTEAVGPEVTNLTQIFDVAMNSWSAGPPQDAARSFQGAAVVRNRIVSIGGRAGAQITSTVEVATQNPLRILVAYADMVRPDALMAQLALEPGVGQVDSFAARTATPTLTNLQAYDVVVAFSNSTWFDAAAMGNVLAAYQDLGGVVVPFAFSWYGGYAIAGTWQLGGYSPFSIGATAFSTATLGAHVEGHPLLAGVDSLMAWNRLDLTTAADAFQVASWSDGKPLIALKGNAVGVSAYVGNVPSRWFGDFAKVIANAGYLLRRGNGPCLRLTCPQVTVITGAITDDDSYQTGRLNRFTPATTCAGEDCPGYYIATGLRHYDAYYFLNDSDANQCVDISLSTPCANPVYLFSEAHLGTFNPISLCSGYLGDLGSSPNGTSLSYSVTVPAWASYSVVVNAVETSTLCSNYQLTVAAGACPASPLKQNYMPLVVRAF